MNPGLRTLIITATLGWACMFPSHASAQDVAADLQAIRKLVEQQNDQIARLSAEVARLGALIDGPRRSPAAPAVVAAPAAPAAPATPATPAAPGTPAEPTPEAVRPTPLNVHVVVKGDSLDKIAKQHGITVQELQKANKISDPKKLQIGQQLTLPPSTEKKEPK